MMSLFETLLVLFAACTLAVFRLAFMLVYEDGFLHIFARLRRWAGVIVVEKVVRDTLGNEQRQKEAHATNPFGEILMCYYCTSVWVALPFSAPFGVLLGIPAAILAWLALAGAAFLLRAVVR